MVATTAGRVLSGTAAVGLGLAVLAAPSDGSAQDLLERAREAGKITVGYANAPPYGFRSADGRLTGEAPEIARLILSKMGIAEIEGVIAEPGSLIADLKAGRFDMIAAGMIVAPRRCAEVLFSEPTFGVTETFLVRPGNPAGLQTFEDVAAGEDAILAVTADAVEGDLARRAGVPEERLLIVPDAAAGARAVAAGEADAFAGTRPGIAEVLDTEEAAGLEQTAPFTSMVADRPALAHGAFAFRKEDAAFAAAFNRHLEDFIGSKGHLAMVEPFGLGEADLPERTTAELCEPVS